MAQARFSRKFFAGFTGVILVAALTAALVSLAGLEVAMAAAVGVLVALIPGYILARRLAAPLDRLVKGAEDLAAGRGGASLPTAAPGAVGRLARAVAQLDAGARAGSERQLAESSRLAAILASMVEGVVAVDGEERVLHLNEAAAEILNCPATGMIGRLVWEVTRIREVREALGEALAHGREVTREARVAQGSREQVVLLHASPLKAGPGGPAGAVVVLHDITRQRLLEEARRDFVANVSHELKTPLTAISALVETIVEDERMEASVRDRFLAKVQGQCGRLTAMVGDLLDLSRLESGDLRQAFELLDLRRTIRQAVSLLQEEAGRREVEVALELPEQAVKIMGDEQALAGMLGNLLENAVKYTGKGGHVFVGAALAGGEVVVTVQDDGMGIEERHHDRIFERFYRVDESRSRDAGGTGLGLSIVKHVALAHGGRVALRSAAGEGSTFQVMLPQAMLEASVG